MPSRVDCCYTVPYGVSEMQRKPVRQCTEGPGHYNIERYNHSTTTGENTGDGVSEQGRPIRQNTEVPGHYDYGCYHYQYTTAYGVSQASVPDEKRRYPAVDCGRMSRVVTRQAAVLLPHFHAAQVPYGVSEVQGNLFVNAQRGRDITTLSVTTIPVLLGRTRESARKEGPFVKTQKCQGTMSMGVTIVIQLQQPMVSVSARGRLRRRLHLTGVTGSSQVRTSRHDYRFTTLPSQYLGQTRRAAPVHSGGFPPKPLEQTASQPPRQRIDI
uniref:Uncharacterized protein n=1 Tax=Branchiostoma floridae TaxID=7739 RepID=C3Z9S5_BRAFL|eukprot:XP_002594760.1 hypothetical protein BRAFLDRAFT_81229 [Branchiostoma floridae]